MYSLLGSVFLNPQNFVKISFHSEGSCLVFRASLKYGDLHTARETVLLILCYIQYSVSNCMISHPYYMVMYPVSRYCTAAVVCISSNDGLIVLSIGT